MTAGAVVWCTGLPASGKSTLAGRIATSLRDRGVVPLVLDGDQLREVLVPRPGHDDAGRDGFYATLGGIATLAAAQGLIVVVAATAHLRRWRDAARAHAPRFVEVHVATSLDDCRRRDPKGLYASAAAGPQLPGVGRAYEAPLHPEVIATGGDDDDAVTAVLARVAPAH